MDMDRVLSCGHIRRFTAVRFGGERHNTPYCTLCEIDDLRQRLAAAEARPTKFRVRKPLNQGGFSLEGWCYSYHDHFEIHWDDGFHEMWRAELSTDRTRKCEAEKAGGDKC